MPQWSDDTEQCRVLEYRRAYLEALVEAHGDPGGHKAREAAALIWVLDLLEATPEMGESVREARQIAARRPPRINVR